MKIKRHRKYVENHYWQRRFWYAHNPDAGFSFACTETGKLLNMNPDAERNFQDCLTGFVGGQQVNDEGIVRHACGYWESAIGICDNCGADVELDGFTCTCECGADYNSSGQRLGPRENWGEETGESLSDILSIP
jgi:hypothetical protein